MWALLPVRSRVRCTLVCRAWRRSLDDPAAWSVCVFSETCPVDLRARNPSWLAAVTERACGRLETLVLEPDGFGSVSLEDVCTVLAANAGSMRQLDVGRIFWVSAERVQAFIRAAPGLTLLDLGTAGGTADDGLLCLQRKEHFATARFHSLDIEAEEEDAPALLRFLTELEQHKLKELRIDGDAAGLPGVLDAVASAVIACDAILLSLEIPRLTPECGPALARLLSSQRLRCLRIEGSAEVILDQHGALLVANALRTNRTLKVFKLQHTWLWDNKAAGVALLGGLTRHPTIQETISNLYKEDEDAFDDDYRAVAGAALGALIAADAEALIILNLSALSLGDVGMRFVAAALPFNTHLHTLDISRNELSEGFVRDCFIPLLHWNTGLKALHMNPRSSREVAGPAIFSEAEAVVNARSSS